MTPHDIVQDFADMGLRQHIIRENLAVLEKLGNLGISRVELFKRLRHDQFALDIYR